MRQSRQGREPEGLRQSLVGPRQTPACRSAATKPVPGGPTTYGVFASTAWGPRRPASLRPCGCGWACSCFAQHAPLGLQEGSLLMPPEGVVPASSVPTTSKPCSAPSAPTTGAGRVRKRKEQLCISAPHHRQVFRTHLIRPIQPCCLPQGRTSPLGVSPRQGCGAPVPSPAACRWARTTGEPIWTSQSMSPAASAWDWAAWSIRSKAPSRAHRRKRVGSVCQGPCRSGTSRQAVPVRNFPAYGACATALLARPGRGRRP